MSEKDTNSSKFSYILFIVCIISLFIWIIVDIQDYPSVVVISTMLAIGYIVKYETRMIFIFLIGILIILLDLVLFFQIIKHFQSNNLYFFFWGIFEIFAFGFYTIYLFFYINSIINKKTSKNSE